MLGTEKRTISVEILSVASGLDYIVLAVFLLIAYFKNGGTRFRYSLEKAKELLHEIEKLTPEQSEHVLQIVRDISYK